MNQPGAPKAPMLPSFFFFPEDPAKSPVKKKPVEGQLQAEGNSAAKDGRAGTAGGGNEGSEPPVSQPFALPPGEPLDEEMNPGPIRIPSFLQVSGPIQQQQPGETMKPILVQATPYISKTTTTRSQLKDGTYIITSNPQIHDTYI